MYPAGSDFLTSYLAFAFPADTPLDDVGSISGERGARLGGLLLGEQLRAWPSTSRPSLDPAWPALYRWLGSDHSPCHCPRR